MWGRVNYFHSQKVRGTTFHFFFKSSWLWARIQRQTIFFIDHSVSTMCLLSALCSIFWKRFPFNLCLRFQLTKSSAIKVPFRFFRHSHLSEFSFSKISPSKLMNDQVCVIKSGHLLELSSLSFRHL